ncbi:sensor histidine kinase-like protein [Clostridium pasteurianum DSM 525 = ATCC 6013]|uniref:Sensor histidine kinase-like protein n=2 Tax=Clostridium pasteurianum TaxID=1501 RepID=A0A0H3J1F8_CLOPA|nr:GHKL domain-containing protein [Clostridium pasteurianum]AJA46567.1 sensor histidine kinase-like protein [Clostridium pasteurianum DSM 525 = ATCC 6013]AJA50555.1 sensor histidine kinase-like protein [Clostridium pasteurianum DSM 525 = ATCC 6013]AOZ73990.1 histidine kinase [Clostridium pasteurianum DSM 525 = ATCC 6013]AOZ77787.1 histidine kinase [Clostridium pasteurianum]ELP61139.1 sensor histidine kinase-like protein [Clostridium pasteurianum DSM 525 = ATCC 6013]
MYNIIFNMAYVLVVSINIGIIINNIIISKFDLKHIVGVIAFSFSTLYLLLIYKEDEFSTPVLTIVLIIYLYIIIRSLIYSIFVSVVTQIIIALSDAFTGMIFMDIFKFDYSEILSNKIIYLFAAVSILLMSTIISKLLNIFFRKIKYNNFFNKNNKNLFLLVLSLIMVLTSIYLSLILFRYLFQTYTRLVAIVNFSIISIFIILVIIINYLSARNYRYKLENKYKDEELKSLNEYTYMIENQSDDLRKFKHDYTNIIKIIGYYIELDDINKLKNFYREELLPESEEIMVKDISFTKLHYIKINPIKVFISSKINIAEKRNIKVNIEVEEAINEIYIGIIDLCRILGILFDNAIEAAELCENKFIELAIIKDDTNITFIINNSCLENTPPVYKLYKKNFSTKGINRGVGLKSAMSIINTNYSNISLNTSMENCVFKQELIICNFKNA